MTANAELVALRTVAARLGPLRDEVVFVGGMIRSLLITDPGAPPARPTDDIDVIAAIASRVEYYAFAERLRQLGFREDHSEGAPVCSWLIDGMKVDVMPDHENVLGFSNRWYPSARATAQWHVIGDGDANRIRLVDAPHFLATKLESFRGRGRGDFYHHDMEDIIAVVDGRTELVDEVKDAPENVRAFVASEVSALMRDDRFREAVPGHLPWVSATQPAVALAAGGAGELRFVSVVEVRANDRRGLTDVARGPNGRAPVMVNT